jgi:hypothetical protein
MVAGYGAILAILWEVGEWYTFIRHGKELDTAYEDTLFDEVLGTTGATVAALITVWLMRRARAATLDVGARDVRAPGEAQ